MEFIDFVLHHRFQNMFGIFTSYTHLSILCDFRQFSECACGMNKIEFVYLSNGAQNGTPLEMQTKTLFIQSRVYGMNRLSANLKRNYDKWNFTNTIQTCIARSHIAFLRTHTFTTQYTTSK